MASNTLTQQEVSFINGKFSPEEAQEILMDLITKKISFHELRNLGHYERTGKSDDEALKRIEQLKASKAEIKEAIEEARNENAFLRVRSSFLLEIVSA